jgi:hypothetical protein
MKQFLIKLLGGYTQAEFEAAGIKADARAEAFDEQIQSWHELLDSREKEVRRLTDLFLTKSGYLVGLSTEPKKDSHPIPLNNRVPWPVKQKELEKADGERHAAELKKRFEQRQATEQMQDGTSADAGIQRDLAELA